MSIKFLALGGGGILGLGGGEVPILFLWARGFFWNFPRHCYQHLREVWWNFWLSVLQWQCIKLRESILSFLAKIESLYFLFRSTTSCFTGARAWECARQPQAMPWEKVNWGGSNLGDFPLFSGKFWIAHTHTVKKSPRQRRRDKSRSGDPPFESPPPLIRFPKRKNQKQNFHVIPWIANQYV